MLGGCKVKGERCEGKGEIVRSGRGEGGRGEGGRVTVWSSSAQPRPEWNTKSRLLATSPRPAVHHRHLQARCDSIFTCLFYANQPAFCASFAASSSSYSLVLLILVIFSDFFLDIYYLRLGLGKGVFIGIPVCFSACLYFSHSEQFAI